MEENIDKKQTKLHIIIIAAILIAALALGTVATVILVKQAKERKRDLLYDRLDRNFDYLTTDLSTYLEIDESLYKNIAVSVTLDSVTDGDVENEILKALAAHKGKALTDEERLQAESEGRTLSPGDVVNIYYRGYTVAADGTETDFAGGSNLQTSSATPLELGSGQFIPGFELSLVGKDPNTFLYTRENSGKIGATDVIFISCGAMLPQAPTGTEFSYTRIDLNNAHLDETYGTGFRDYLLSLTVGQINTTPRTFPLPDGTGDAVYYDMLVNYLIHADATPLTIDAYFPDDYGADSGSASATELAATHVKFDVYLESYTAYTPAVLDDTFVTDVLKLTDDDLKDYAGETPTEKYRAKIRADLDKAYEEKKTEKIRSAMFNYYYEHAKILRLPVYNVTVAYQDKLAELKQQYASELVGMDENSEIYTSLQNYCYQYAVNSVTESLVYYGVLRHSGLLVEKGSAAYNEVYDRLLDKELANYIDFYKVTESSFKDDPDGKTAAEKFADWKTDRRGKIAEEYFAELEEDTYFEFAVDTLLSYVHATVTDARAQ